MRIWNANLASVGHWLAERLFKKKRFAKVSATLATLLLLTASGALAQTAGDTAEAGGEAALKLPDLSSVSFLGVDGHRLLMIGLLFCVFGLGFGMTIFMRLKNLPVHRSMREISELIYETCKTYLITQGKFLMLLWVFIAVIIAVYFGWLKPVPGKSVALTLPIILLFSIVGIAGSYGVAWHSRQYFCEFADRLRFSSRQTLSGLSDSAGGRNVDWDDADLGRTADH